MSINVRILGVLIVLMFIFVLFLDGLNSKYLKKFYRCYKCFYLSHYFLIYCGLFMVKSIENLVYTLKACLLTIGVV